MGGEGRPRWVPEPVGFGRDDACAGFEVPQDVEATARVVVEAHQAHERRLTRRADLDVVDEPLTVAGVDHLPFAGNRSSPATGGRRLAVFGSRPAAWRISA